MLSGMSTARKPAPPKHLTAASRRVWARVAEDYELFDEVHALQLLTHALEAHERCDQARELIQKEGIVVVMPSGAVKAHPAVGIERDSRLACARLWRELSLDGSPGGYDASRPPRVGGGF